MPIIPKNTEHLIPGTFIPVLLSSLSVLLAFKNEWIVSGSNLIQRRQNSPSLATDRPGSQLCTVPTHSGSSNKTVQVNILLIYNNMSEF